MSEPIFKSIILLILATVTNLSHAQLKYEKESRLNVKKIPSVALAFIDSLPVEKKVKWYREEGIDRTSIEAKFKMNGEKYSIEFSPDGELEDIEIQIPSDQLPQSLRDSIEHQLDQDCKSYRIQKTQIQYTGQTAVLLSKITTAENPENYTTRYELVVKCRKEKSVDLYEYLFSDTGQELSVSKIIFKNSSHLEY